MNFTIIIYKLERKSKVSFEVDHESAIFEIAKDINRENYPAFIEDYCIKEKLVDKTKVFSAIERVSELRALDSHTLIDDKGEIIPYNLFEKALYNMVYHQICNLNI